MKKNPYKNGDKIDLFGLKYTYKHDELVLDKTKGPLAYIAPYSIRWYAVEKTWFYQGFDGATPRSVFLKVLRNMHPSLKADAQDARKDYDLISSQFDAVEEVLKKAKTK